MKITDIEKITLAKLFHIEPKALDAVILVESSGSGFNADGTIKIQFEPTWFRKYTGKKIANGVEGQHAEWLAFQEAFAIDSHAALCSTSWGLGQVMGFNHKSAGYATPEEMVRDFKESEVNQVKGMINFIQADYNMLKALQAKDWAGFAKHYNGPQYLSFKYDTRLQEAYSQSKLPA